MSPMGDHVRGVMSGMYSEDSGAAAMARADLMLDREMERFGEEVIGVGDGA